MRKVFYEVFFFSDKQLFECAKFRGSRAIVGLVGLVGLVPSCYRAFVGISWAQYFFLWVFRGSQVFCCGYFVGPRFFLVGISWVQDFFSWVFRGSKIFSREYFMVLKFSLVSNFVIFSCWAHAKKWHRNISQTSCSIPNRFQQL